MGHTGGHSDEPTSFGGMRCARGERVAPASEGANGRRVEPRTPQALAVGVSGGLQKVNTEGLFIAAGQEPEATIERERVGAASIAGGSGRIRRYGPASLRHANLKRSFPTVSRTSIGGNRHGSLRPLALRTPHEYIIDNTLHIPSTLFLVDPHPAVGGGVFTRSSGNPWTLPTCSPIPATIELVCPHAELACGMRKSRGVLTGHIPAAPHHHIRQRASDTPGLSARPGPPIVFAGASSPWRPPPGALLFRAPRTIFRHRFVRYGE